MRCPDPYNLHPTLYYGWISLFLLDLGYAVDAKKFFHRKVEEHVWIGVVLRRNQNFDVGDRDAVAHAAVLIEDLQNSKQIEKWVSSTQTARFSSTLEISFSAA
jgi:hypothetical protein